MYRRLNSGFVVDVTPLSLKPLRGETHAEVVAEVSRSRCAMVLCEVPAEIKGPSFKESKRDLPNCRGCCCV